MPKTPIQNEGQPKIWDIRLSLVYGSSGEKKSVVKLEPGPSCAKTLIIEKEKA